MGGLDKLVDAIADLTAGFSGSAVHAAVVGALAAVFVWSGLAKARRPWLTAMAIVDFGVGRHPRIGLARFVTWGEVGLGVALGASLWAAPWMGVAVAVIAAAVLLGFTLLIARAVRGGRTFACYCFGEAENKVSSATLARTATLAVLAVTCTAAAAGAGGPFSGEQAALGLFTGLAVVGSVATGARARALWPLPQPPEGRAATLVGPAE